MATLSQIKQDFYDIVGEPTNSSVYPSSETGGTYVELLANRVQDTICRENKWWFLKTKYLFNTALDTTLDGDVDTTDITIDLTSATGYPTTGAIWVEEDIINYTGLAANQLTGVTNIDIDHSSGDKVEIMYSSPSDFSHEPRLILKGSGAKPIMYEKVDSLDDGVESYDDHNYNFGDETYRWSFVIDKNGNEFIRLKNPSSSQIAVFHYFKVATTMTDIEGSTIPDPFARKVIPFFMADMAMKERGDNPDGLADSILQEATRELNKMKNYNMRRLFGKREKVFNMYRSGNGTRTRRIIIT